MVSAESGVDPIEPESPDGPAAVILDGDVAAASLGGKGAALDRLIRWGLPVPATGAVTADCYRRFAADPDVVRLIDRIVAGGTAEAAEVDACFADVSLDPGDLDEIQRVARQVGGGSLLAVRSSATVEDLDRSSFAGQYRSLLDIDPSDRRELARAVKMVFASLWHPAPCAYRRAFGIPDDDVAMAVVLMAMVPARRAGVVFTVDPGGDESRARVELVEGLGESLVSGQETPEAALLEREGERESAPPEVVTALDLGLRIEAEAGSPQDVEWAWDGNAVWVVQARPITVSASSDGDGFDDAPERLVDLDLTTAGIGEMLPGVLPPLVWGLAGHLVEDAFRGLLDDLGVPPVDLTGPTGLIVRVRGRAAMDFSRLRDMAGGLPGSAPEELEEEYFGSRRRGRSAARDAPARQGRLRSVEHDVRVLGLRHRAALDASLAVHAAEAIAADGPDLAGLDASHLLAYHLRLMDLADRTMAAEVGVAADAAATFRRLQLMVARHLGEVEAGRQVERLLAGVGVTATPSPRASAAVFAGPTWEELGRTPPRPPNRADRGRSDQPLDDLFAALSESPSWNDESFLTRLRRRSIRRLADETATRMSLRESSKAALLSLGGEVRRVHLEAARRLVEGGLLSDVEDIDLLSPAEFRATVRGTRIVPPDVVARRRRWRVRCEQEGPLPPRFSGLPTRVELAPHDGRPLEGWAASPGRFRGMVQVVDSPTDELTRDAVLVAEATDPSWSPLFMAAGAIVLDRGGPLSHAAILARELGVPAVLNVPGATSILAGHVVTVDGDSGVVVIHEPDSDARSDARSDSDSDSDARSDSDVEPESDSGSHDGGAAS